MATNEIKLKVNLENGVNLAVEGKPQDVDNFIENLMQRIKNEKFETTKLTIEQHIQKLIDQEFFNEKRTFRELRVKIRLDGRYIPRQSLYSVFYSKFIQTGIMHREGQLGNRRYFV